LSWWAALGPLAHNNCRCGELPGGQARARGGQRAGAPGSCLLGLALSASSPGDFRPADTLSRGPARGARPLRAPKVRRRGPPRCAHLAAARGGLGGARPMTGGRGRGRRAGGGARVASPEAWSGAGSAGAVAASVVVAAHPWGCYLRGLQRVAGGCAERGGRREVNGGGRAAGQTAGAGVGGRVTQTRQAAARACGAAPSDSGACKFVAHS
jgi:hypothetical protein